MAGHCCDKTLDACLYERMLLIKYQSPSGEGKMLVRLNHYEKKQAKFRRLFKDCNIYYMSEIVLTPEELERMEAMGLWT